VTVPPESPPPAMVSEAPAIRKCRRPPRARQPQVSENALRAARALRPTTTCTKRSRSRPSKGDEVGVASKAASCWRGVAMWSAKSRVRRYRHRGIASGSACVCGPAMSTATAARWFRSRRTNCVPSRVSTTAAKLPPIFWSPPTASSPRRVGHCCLPSSRVMLAMWLGGGWQTWQNCPGRPAICCGTGSHSTCQTANRHWAIRLTAARARGAAIIVSGTALPIRQRICRVC
jgi:hypothetical protein